MQDNLESFFEIDSALLESVKSIGSNVPYSSGARIFGEGDKSNSVYFILKGETRAIRYSEGGSEVWLDEFSSGSLFGEMASLQNDVRTADMYALTDTLVAVIPGKAFINLIRENGTFAHLMCKLLATRIQNTTRRVFEQATLTATARIYAELLRMAAPMEDTPASIIRNMLTISDLATKLNIARETVSRTVSKLKEENLLEAKDGDLFITKPYELVNRLNQ